MTTKRILSRGPPNPEDEPPIKFRKPSKPPDPVVPPAAPVPSTSRSTPAVPANVQLYNNLQPVRLMRVGSRRARNRPNRKIRYAMRYAQAVGMDPTRLEETFRLEEANTLVAVAIEHYAKTVSGIVEELEAKLQANNLNATSTPEEPADVPMETDACVVEETTEPSKPSIIKINNDFVPDNQGGDGGSFAG